MNLRRRLTDRRLDRLIVEKHADKRIIDDLATKYQAACWDRDAARRRVERDVARIQTLTEENTQLRAEGRADACRSGRGHGGVAPVERRAGRAGERATMSTRLGSCALVVDGDRILLGQRGKHPNYGKWVMPGGKVEPFESIAAAAIREFAEETGLAIEIVDRLSIEEDIDESLDHHFVFVVSLGRVTGGTLTATSDLLDARWFDRSEVPDLDLSPVCRPILARLGWA